jgi:hypothetical protein
MADRRCSRWRASMANRATTEPIVVTVRREFAEEVSALRALLDEGLVEMEHTDGCMCEGTRKLTAACVSNTMTRHPR